MTYNLDAELVACDTLADGRVVDHRGFAGQRSPHPVINLVIDPQEREPVSVPYLHSWTAIHFNRILDAFQKTLRDEPLRPAGAPLDHVPRAPRAEGT